MVFEIEVGVYESFSGWLKLRMLLKMEDKAKTHLHWRMEVGLEYLNESFYVLYLWSEEIPHAIK